MFTSYKRLRQNEDGASILEFAIIAPVLFLVIITGIELAMISFSSVVVESATSMVTRTARVAAKDNHSGTDVNNQTYSNNDGAESTSAALARNAPNQNFEISLEDRIRNAIRDKSGGLLDADQIIITTDSRDYAELTKPEKCLDENPSPGSCESWLDSNGNGIYDTAEPALDTGQDGDYVQYYVYYPLPMLTPIGNALFGEEDGKFIVKSYSLVVNESS